MAHSYRRATIKVTFAPEHARPRAYEVEQFIRDDLRLNPREVIGIHFSITGNVVYIKMTSEEVCADVVRQHAQGHKFKHSDGHIGDVMVDHAGFGLRTIRVFELPFEVPQDVVVEAFRPYGKVVGHLAEKWQTFTTYQVLNGVRQIKIELSKHVPSYLMIGGVRAIIMYDGQPRTCSGCGQEGHVRSDCLRRRLLQVTTGDAAPAATATPLPDTYASAVRDPEASLQDAPVLPRALPLENNGEDQPSPAPSPMTVTTPQSSMDRPPNAMDIDPSVVPTSAFIQTGTMSDAERPHSDTEQRVRKQRSPRKRKKRSRTPSDDTLLHAVPHEVDQMTDCELPSHALTAEVAVSDVPSEERPIHRLQSCPTTSDPVEGGPLDDTVAVSPPPTQDGCDSRPPTVPVSWADDVEDGANQDTGPTVGEYPTVAPTSASIS